MISNKIIAKRPLLPKTNQKLHRRLTSNDVVARGRGIMILRTGSRGAMIRRNGDQVGASIQFANLPGRLDGGNRCL